MAERFETQHVGLDEVHALTFRLAERIRAARFEPDVVVAVARGGFVPARLVCDFLRVAELASLQIRHYGAGARKEREAELLSAPNARLAGRRVLLVDDVNDTGDTLAAARDAVAAGGPAELRVAVLHEKEGTGFQADFCAARVEQWRWILYHWAVVEDVNGFLDAMDPPPRGRDEARARLKQDYGLVLGDDLWEEIFAARPR
jgi:hypoxanthine phosphoribosyltransferase